jgi:hypothetical protein
MMMITITIIPGKRRIKIIPLFYLLNGILKAAVPWFLQKYEIVR